MTDRTASPAASDHGALAASLAAALHLAVAPIGISFGDEAPPGVPAFDEPMSAPAADGRAGRVPAGCVFWVRAAERSFTTVPEDHGNCSVGRYTHGLASLEDVAGNADVAALLESGWVDAEAVGGIPAVSAARRRHHLRAGDRRRRHPRRRPAAGERPADDGAVRRPARPAHRGQAPVPHRGARQGGRCGGRQRRLRAQPGPYRHATRRDDGAPSRAARLAEVVAAVERAAAIDTVVAKYAADDARRFAATA